MNDIALGFSKISAWSRFGSSNAKQKKVSGDMRRTPIDWFLVILVASLVCFGLLMIYSTTGITSAERYHDGLLFVKKQLVAVCCGLGLAFASYRISLKWLERISVFALMASLLLLVLPWVPGLGSGAGGATRWISLGFFRFQPGEFVKLLMVIFFAGYISRHERELSTFRGSVFVPALLFLPIAGLLLLQPDFGSTAVIATVVLIMLVTAGMPLRYIVIASVAALGIGSLLVVLSPYRMGRIMSFLSPFADTSGKGYQLIQSLIAIGGGKITGVGLGESQQKLFFLPAAHNDFIFAVISEELGLLGGLMVLMFFLLILWRGLRLATRLRSDPFLFSLSVGLLGLIIVPAFLNVGVVTGLLPTKGLVLPFVSYGGSSIMMSLAVVGILTGLSKTTLDAPRQGKVH